MCTIKRTTTIHSMTTNMNSFKPIAAAAALILMTAACTNEDALTYGTDPEAVRLAATIGTDGTALPVNGGLTRSLPMGDEAEQARFAANDQISVQAGEQTAVVYTLTDGSWTPEAGKYLRWETATMPFAAYYPVGKNNASMTTFSVPTDQSTPALMADADYMTYTSTTSTAKADKVDIALTRRMARVVVSGITFLDQYATGYHVSAITVAGNTTGYTAADALASGNVTVKSCQVGTGTAAQFYALLAPTAATADATFLSVTVKKDGTAAGEGETTLTVKGIPALTAGNSYAYTLAVGKDMMNVGTVTVTDWTTGAVIGSEDGNEAGELAFPDDAFVKYLSGTLSVPLTNGEIDPTQPATKAALEAITEIDVANNTNIKSLKGIEYCTQLSTLYCYNTGITSLDVSKCTELGTLYCYGIQITSLDVSKCTKLSKLECSGTGITALDVSSCTNLNTLYCSYTQITSLDVSSCTNLRILRCSSTQITSLDVSKCTGLSRLECSNRLNKIAVSLTIKTATYDALSSTDFKGREESVMVTLNKVD